MGGGHHTAGYLLLVPVFTFSPRQIRRVKGRTMTRVLVSPSVRGIYGSLMIVIESLVAKKDTRMSNRGVRGPQ